MRKKFAEDDLLGRFRLKNNASLRIDLKPTPPEQVEEVIKKMEPLIETLGTPEQSQSSLSIDWNNNEIEVPDNMPSDVELKAILFREPKDDVPPEQIDIFKSQRHQKMLELLAKVEALTQHTAVVVTQFDETPSKPPEVHASDDLQGSEMESLIFNGEEAAMRSDTEQFQAVQGKQTAAELKASEKETQDTPALEKVFKLDVDHEDFQERLIRILNENYSDMGEIRPHNLKSRLIEILNEEYAEDYLEQDDFDEDDLEEDGVEEVSVEEVSVEEVSVEKGSLEEEKLEEDSLDDGSLDVDTLDEDILAEDHLEDNQIDDSNCDEVNSGEAGSSNEEFNGFADMSKEPEIHSEIEDVKSSEAEQEPEQAVNIENNSADSLIIDVETLNEEVKETAPDSAVEPEPEVEPDVIQEHFDASEQLTNTIDQPKMVLPAMRDPSGFLPAEYNHNSPDLKPTWEDNEQTSEAQPSDYPPVRRNRERFSHFQYVTSFHEVSESEAEPEEKPEIAEDSTASEGESPWTPQKAAAAAEEEEEEEEEALSPLEDLKPDPETRQPSDRLIVDSDLHHMKPGDDIRTDEHRWLKELREEGSEEDSISEASEPQPVSEYKWASAEVFGAAEQDRNQETFQERGWDRNQQQEEEQVYKAERRFGVEAAETAKSEGTAAEKNVAQNSERYMSVEEWSFVFDTLKEQIDYLRKQLEIKDHQLQNKDELIRNFQILLKNEQDKFLKLENKMEDVVLQVEERAAKKGFFSRFRKR
ncbi:hypothetical protein [Acidaminobacter sp.]|uniref:hypothetical protein n=1 Tax=Acidaminobacter sp. TaxID=1872102 RepID=UPI00255FDB19|nr:hypothetical protein [Acidaminobacter sp.]MDK9711000.1 hypothetical protein [Acidaminobacter sp.]